MSGNANNRREVLLAVCVCAMCIKMWARGCAMCTGVVSQHLLTPQYKNVSKNKLFDIQQIKHKRKTERERENPGRMLRGFGGLCVAFVVAVSVVVTQKELLRE